ncbi:MAG: UDP-N-acetylmuramoyl-L-alanine--D-glutamate ligase [bacterium]
MNIEGKPTVFEFSSYKFEPENKRAVFNYKQEFDGTEAINFTETLQLPQIPDVAGLPEGLVDKVLQGAHLILGISYYKFYCASIVRHKYDLTEREADFWNAVYKKGLGEFFYKNNLDPKNSPKFSFNKNLSAKSFRIEKNNKCLVAVSGGKDSIVAAELLKEAASAKAPSGQAGIDITAIFTESQRGSELVDSVIKELSVKSLRFRRILDPKILERHKYDGHVPVSAMFAFLGILYAVLYRHAYCIMANEYSSNFGNTTYKGEMINHQWSKSSEFENMFSNYVFNFITPEVKYFSLLRPFYEIRIAELFSKHKKYFPYFSSCNKNFTVEEIEKKELWCGECPKCVFTFTLLSAFLSKKELLSIFKKNLYQDRNLLPLFKDILGLGKIKPFDCVGTFEESKAAFRIANKKFRNDFIVKTLLAKVKINASEIKNLFKTHRSDNIPAEFRFLGMKSILILGYGREGEISKKYIQKKYPKLRIGIADKKQEKNYLKKQANYDLVVKAPGIPKELVTIPYTTATNIFFSEIKRLGNKTIGVTGSKGKSTTASLIYAILKEDGKNVRVLGNIGKPMLEVLLEPIKKDEIFVLELSSYQLDDIEFSPNISVVTNLFPEHLDYHLGAKNYYEAKKNIIKFQSKQDLFIYNPKNKKSCQWAEGTNGKSIPFAPERFLKGFNFPLLGKHNIENARAAFSVAKELGISDKIVKSAIEKFEPLPHRLEFIGEFKGIKFYDDAISTTPESTIAAIEALLNIDTIFLGGEDRGYNFSHLEKTVKQYKIKNVVLFPDSGKRINLKGVNILRTKSMEEAVKFAYKNTDRGKICLLSCASPSYSLWKNFEEKGDKFQLTVKRYGKK